MLLDAARRYAGKVAAAREGGRNDTAFNLAGHLAAFVTDAGEKLAKADILAVVAEWNRGCSPPLSDRELQSALSSGMTNGEPREPHIVETRRGDDGELRVTSIVEKPAPEDAPSNLAVVGRYLLTPGIFDKLEQTGTGAGGEIQLTDGIADLLQDEPVIAYPFRGKRYDCGSKLGYLEATVEYGLAHSELGSEFAAYLKRLGVCG